MKFCQPVIDHHMGLVKSLFLNVPVLAKEEVSAALAVDHMVEVLGVSDLHDYLDDVDFLGVLVSPVVVEVPFLDYGLELHAHVVVDLERAPVVSRVVNILPDLEVLVFGVNFIDQIPKKLKDILLFRSVQSHPHHRVYFLLVLLDPDVDYPPVHVQEPHDCFFHVVHDVRGFDRPAVLFELLVLIFHCCQLLAPLEETLAANFILHVPDFVKRFSHPVHADLLIHVFFDLKLHHSLYDVGELPAL